MAAVRVSKVAATPAPQRRNLKQCVNNSSKKYTSRVAIIICNI